MRIIAIINQKGGCGKTTSAINLAGIMARKGLRTLLVDMDPQSHCAAGLAIPEGRIDLDIGDAMLAGPEAEIDPKRLLWRASRNLDLAPSRMKLAGLEAARGGLADQPDKERRLAGVLARFAHQYDVCFVDCSPSIGLLTFNALAAATEILIPVETSFFALQGATKQVNTIRTLAKRLGTAAPYWVFATLHDEGSVLARDLLEELKRRFGARVAPEVIRRDPTLKEAASFGQPIIEYSPTSAGARDYTALAEWLVAEVGLGSGSRPRTPRVVEADPAETFDGRPADPATLPEIAPGVEAKLPVETVPGAVTVEPEPGSEAGSGGVSRAEDLAQRARVMLLKRTDEQLKRINAAGGLPEPAIAPGPIRGTDFLGEPKSVLVREGTARAKGETIRSLFGARQTRSGTLFVQPLSLGDRVAIAGDFNGWAAIPMKRNDQLGVYELCLPVPPGRRRYRLVVDDRWITDPFNEVSEPNPFGELNSVIEVAPTPKPKTA